MLNLPPIVVALAQTAPAQVRSTAVSNDAGLAFALALGIKPSATEAISAQPVSVAPLTATASQSAREAAVAAIVAEDRVSFELSAAEAPAEQSSDEDWLALALD